jgi:protein SCO1/2
MPTASVRTLADFKGKVTVVFFGYTQCPDVCPTTMAELAEVKKSLGADGARVQGMFVTVDPERDTPELKAYVTNFDPRLRRAARHARRDGGRGQGLQGVLRQGAGQDRGQLHHGSHRRQLRVRRPRARAASVHRYGSGAEALAARPEAAAGGTP